MRHAAEAAVVYRAADIETVQLLLLAAVLVALCLALYATWPL